jgi:mannose-1-phosphate guanylyltransferase/mannose-1-phosphate guanylyltransferase/phosphomannomutase
MAPIVNRPALYHILDLLRRHGFREVIINLHHLAETIRAHFGDGTAMGMEISYSYEPELMGTAGGVKNNADFFGKDTFLVMSGDALTDIDLGGLVAAHRRHGSIATMSVKEVADPSLYGVVVADDDDRVVGFQEKPTIEEARSRLCNCGIYVFEPEILSHIPAGEFDDFGTRLLPDLLKQQVPYHIHAIDEYWNDVGNLKELVRGNSDALYGHVAAEIPGDEIQPGVWVDEGALLAASVKMEPPVAIGRGCDIGEGVVIEGPTVIGEGCVVGAQAHLARTLLLGDARVPTGALLVEGIVARQPEIRG